MAATLDDIEAELHGEIAGVLGEILVAIQEGGSGGGGAGSKSDKEGAGPTLSGTAGTIAAVIGGLVLFTAALNPAAAQAFTTAMSGLVATIGQAALPALTVLTGVVGDLAGKVSPLAQQLGPVLAQIANAIGSILVPIVGMLADDLQIVLTILEPFIRIITDWAQVLGAMAKVGEAVVHALLSFIQGLAGSDVKDASDRLHKAFEKLANQLLILAASILSLLGLDDAVKTMLANLEKEGKDKGVQAAGQTSYQAFADAAKTLAENAAKSGYGDAGNRDKFNFGEAIEGIKGVLSGNGGYLRECRDFLKILAHPADAAARGVGINTERGSLWDDLTADREWFGFGRRVN